LCNDNAAPITGSGTKARRISGRRNIGGDGAELRADGSADIHDERNQNIDIAFDGVTKRSVAGEMMISKRSVRPRDGLIPRT
jgi:hypothetical protein